MEKQSELFGFPTSQRRVFSPAPRYNEKQDSDELSVKGAIGSCLIGGLFAIAADAIADKLFNKDESDED